MWCVFVHVYMYVSVLCVCVCVCVRERERERESSWILMSCESHRVIFVCVCVFIVNIIECLRGCIMRGNEPVLFRELRHTRNICYYPRRERQTDRDRQNKLLSAWLIIIIINNKNIIEKKLTFV